MTVIFSNVQDDDCITLQNLWRDIPNVKVIELTPNSTDWEQSVDDAIAAENDTLILAGHGTTQGLLAPCLYNGEYVIHQNNVGLIHAKNVFCMWCYASTFCRDNKLHSFSTSMFISNTGEAWACNGRCLQSQEDINNLSRKFCLEVRQLILENTPLDQWQMILGAKMDAENEIDTYNRQGLYYL